MRNKGIMRLAAALMVVVLCTTAFSVTAFAYGGDTSTEATEAPKPDMEETGEPDGDIAGLIWISQTCFPLWRALA